MNYQVAKIKTTLMYKVTTETGEEFLLQRNDCNGGAFIPGGWYGSFTDVDPILQGRYLGDTRKEAIIEWLKGTGHLNHPDKPKD